MMELTGVHRIDGVKYEIGRLTVEELRNINESLVTKQAQLIADIALVSTIIFERTQPENIIVL